MRRREFISGLGSTVAWPLAARAQQSAMPAIGYLSGNSRAQWGRFVAAFNAGLKELDFVEGQNVAIEYRSAEGQYDRLPMMASDLVRRNVAVIAAAGGTESALAAKAATAAIPIVVVVGRDPVELGLVSSLNRPGGNVTGVSLLNVLLAPKRLELVREVVPNASRIAVLVNPRNRNAASYAKDIQAAALSGRQQIVVQSASDDFDGSFAALVQRRAEALIVVHDPFFDSRRDQLIALAARHAIPTIYGWREFVAAGGLMSYGTSLAEANRQTGIYTGRILKGEKPADLPVQQATKVELVINLKTAKALAITLPLCPAGCSEAHVGADAPASATANWTSNGCHLATKSDWNFAGSGVASANRQYRGADFDSGPCDRRPHQFLSLPCGR
jgi:putative ABC transport system substrate-binding protein